LSLTYVLQVHHKYQYCNFNLMVGGDFMRCVYRAPSQRDLDEMAAIKIPIH